VIVTAGEPPAVDPLVGLIDVIVGGGFAVIVVVAVAELFAGFGS
jgi:hypothetical protein